MVNYRNNLEKKRILEQHKYNEFNRTGNTYAIVEWLSPDNRYAIFLDDLIDIKRKKIIGNIVEDFSNLKFFLEHSFSVSKKLPNRVKQALINEVRSIDDSTDIRNHKNLISETIRFTSKNKKLIIEQENNNGGILSSIGNWASGEYEKTKQGLSNFINTGIEGAKKLGKAISDSDLSKALEIVQKGTLYVARSIRSAVTSTAYAIVDAILVACGVITLGVTEVVHMIPWAISALLDVYEFATGEYEDPNMSNFERIFMFGIHCVGMATTGYAARAMKAQMSTIPKDPAKLETIKNSILSFPNLASKALTFLEQKAPKIFAFFRPVVSKIKDFMKYVTDSFAKLIPASKTGQTVAKAARAGGKEAAIDYGVNAGLDFTTSEGLKLFAAALSRLQKNDAAFKQLTGYSLLS